MLTTFQPFGLVLNPRAGILDVNDATSAVRKVVVVVVGSIGQPQQQPEQALGEVGGRQVG